MIRGNRIWLDRISTSYGTQPKGYHKGQELTTSDLGLRQEELSNQPLELFAREGARLVLAVALEEEIAGFLQRQKYERRHGNRRGYSDIPQ